MCTACAPHVHVHIAEQVGRATLKLLEVVPGLTVWDLLMKDWDGRDVNQIGRQPPLSSNKATSHFPRLKESTGMALRTKTTARRRRPVRPSSLGQPRPIGRCVPAGHYPHRRGVRPHALLRRL